VEWYEPPHDHRRDVERHRLEEKSGAAAIQLRADGLGEMDRAASRIEIHGVRCLEHAQKMIGR